MGYEGIQGIQGGHLQAAAGGQAEENSVGVRRDVIEKSSIGEEDLLGLVRF